MEKKVKISSKDVSKLKLFLMTLKEVAKDMKIRVETLHYDR